METDLELKNIYDNQLKEADMVVDDENNLVDTEIQEVNGDIDEEENLVATTVPQTPRPSLYLHSETPGGSVYWEPNVESIYLPIEGKVFDTIKECVDFYTFYAEIGGFEVKKWAQKKLKAIWYDMVFISSTGIDNHRKCVTVGSGMLLKEDIEAYTWLLRSFMTALEKRPTMIVTNQDGAMKLAIEEVLTESKHRLCMWHIMQKLSAKEIIEAVWACQILECKTEDGCEIVKVIDKRASAYRTLNTEKEKEVVQQKKYVAEYKKTCDVIEDIYAVEKLQQNDVNNPQRARNKGVEKLQQNDVNNPQRARNKGGQRGERRKSGREIALKAKTRQIRKCLCCGEKTNKHTKSTCPSNPKYVAKLARLVAAIVAEQVTTTAAANEQGATTAVATEEATTTVIVSEEATNAS
nr:protein FAR1-related sequence 5-like [Tanacetum cinerariifolium]